MQLDLMPKEKRSAIFSDCRRWRYTLRIVWDEAKPLCQFIGLNPSTADEIKDDPTLRRCKGFCRQWGFGGLIMTNLFAYRATEPEDMKAFAGDPVGEAIPRGAFTELTQFDNLNDYYLWTVAEECTQTIAAWGVHGAFRDRAVDVMELFEDFSLPMYCLGCTQDGHPKHPLYLSKNLKPIAFT